MARAPFPAAWWCASRAVDPVPAEPPHGTPATRPQKHAPTFRLVVRADGPWPLSGRAVLLLDVLAQDGDRGAAGGPGDVGPGPQPVRPPVVTAQVRELLPQPSRGHALEAVDQPGQGRPWAGT